MSKKKKIIISALAALVLILAVSAILLVRHFRAIAKTGLRNDVVPYGFGKEATVILLAGQSNAAGSSHDEYLKMNVSAEKYAEYEAGYDNVYINYYVSGTNDSGGFVKCKARQGEFGTCFGPELGLAERLNELYPEREFFIIKWAWGGTRLYDQWRSPSSGETGDLYSGFVQYVNNSVDYLRLKNYKVNIEAMCWMQGESDSVEDEYTLSYEARLTGFIGDLRNDFAPHTAEGGMAFIDAYIAATIFWKNYIELNAAKQAVADSTPINSVIDTIGAGMTVINEPYDEPDIAHYDSLSEIKLGHLFADEVAKFLD